jgi:hypothetical protein
MPLSPNLLAQHFGAKSEPARRGIPLLYGTLLADPAPELRHLIHRWKTAVASAGGHDPDRPTPGIDQMAEAYGIPTQGLQPAELLLAAQTYFALVVERLVGRIVPRYARKRTGVSRPDLSWSNSRHPDPFTWYDMARSEPIEAFLREAMVSIGRFDLPLHEDRPPEARDLFGALYQNLLPQRLRHGLGEYYTPDWLADHVLDQVHFDGDPKSRLLDPACGSGVFLMAAIRRIRARYASQPPGERPDPAELGRDILAGVVGFDLNPLAVLSARANYLIAMGDLLPHLDDVRIPVFLHDSILDKSDRDERAEDLPANCREFDYVVGNPPWIAWDNLPAGQRRATASLWREYGLFTLSGSEARHGGGKKDLSMLMLYAAADRYLKQGGHLGMVITQTLFQTKGAGDGFRRFRIGPTGAWLGVRRVDDMVRMRPFAGAANWTATIAIEKGRKTVYPIPYVQWSPAGNSPEKHRLEAAPIDPARESSPWLVQPVGLDVDLGRLIGPSDYRAHLGANTGGANGVYWVELAERTAEGVRIRNLATRGKRAVAAVEAIIEPDLIYPLLRWSDVARYRASPSAHLLLAQDVQTRRGIDEREMADRYPRTHAYLKRFEGFLVDRAAYRRYQQRAPFYSMYNVGRYTVAPVKVVWRRMDRRINAAVVEPLVDPLLGPRCAIPQETCVLIAVHTSDEAHYVAAVLNSSTVGFLVASHSVRGGKGFGTPSMLDFIRLARFDSSDFRHRKLAAAGERAQRTVHEGKDASPIQAEIDALAAPLWGLTSDQAARLTAGSSQSS